MPQFGEIRGNFISTQYSGFSNSLSSNTISATTFFGNISAKFIGTGTTFGESPNFVTDLEFSYLSGTTSNIQLQINTKAPKNETYLTYSSTTELSNYKKLSAGTNVIFKSSTTHFTTYAYFDKFNASIIYDTPSTPENRVIPIYFPQNWSDAYPNRATHLILTPTATTQIYRLSATSIVGTSSRICTITNKSNHLIILGGINSSSLPGGFMFPSIKGNSSGSYGYFLMPNKSITLIYSTVASYIWFPISIDSVYGNIVGLDFVDLLLGAPDINGILQTNFFQSKYFVISATPLESGNNGAIYNGEGRNTFPIGIGVKNNKITYSGILNNNSFQKDSGKSFLGVLGGTTGSISQPPTTYRGPKLFGTSNNFIGNIYTGLTNNPSKIPNVNGGTFFLQDYDLNANYWLNCVQTSDGSTIMSASTLPYSAFTTSPSNSSIYELGIYTINPSGSSFGSTTFFWRLSTDNYWTFNNTIHHTGTTINGCPNFSMWGVSGYGNDISSLLTNVQLHYMGIGTANLD